MKKLKIILIGIVTLSFIYAGKIVYKKFATPVKEINVRIYNPLNIIRKDEIISLQISKLKKEYPDFNYNSFVIYSDGKEIPSQVAFNNRGFTPEKILFLVNINPNETKIILIKYSKDKLKKNIYKKMTGSYLGEKINYKLVNGFYTGGKFVSVHSVKVPQTHFAHDGLYQFEGPGWESELVDYRFYLDSRNRNDIFGKKVHELVMPGIGIHDLVSNSRETYTKMLNWGMDIFKVNESLGIGSLAMYLNGKVETVSKTDSLICTIADNGPIYSGVYTNYYGWNVNGKKYNSNSLVSITAGSRLTETNVDITGNPKNITTGLAKHENTEYVKSESKGEWQYISLYGEQSLAGHNDKLGIAVFYKNSDLIKQTQDPINYIVVLKLNNGKLKYYFADVWDQELNGIKNQKEFINYLNEVIEKLDNQVKVDIL